MSKVRSISESGPEQETYPVEGYPGPGGGGGVCGGADLCRGNINNISTGSATTLGAFFTPKRGGFGSDLHRLKRDTGGMPGVLCQLGPGVGQLVNK